jgi:hypothetical protein
MGDYRSAIARIESGGNYGALGPYTKGDRPYGKYQVMGANIGPWTQQALGRRLTAQQFLADPAAQDATFDVIFGDYVNKYGPRGAAQAWFGGPGSVGKSGRKDVLGTSVGSYGQQFVEGLGAGVQAGPLAAPSATPQTEVSQPMPIADPSTGTVIGDYDRPLPFEPGYGGQQLAESIIGGTLKSDLRAALFGRIARLFI